MFKKWPGFQLSWTGF